MINLVWVLVAAALASVECSAKSLIDNKLEIDNSLQPNVVPTPKLHLEKYLVIAQPPPETVRHVTGTTLVLQCGIMGYPAPSVSWLKNGVMVFDLELEGNEIMSVKPQVANLTSKLVIRAPSHGDVYTCVATSGHKQQTASTTLFSIEGENDDMLTKLIGMPPIITAIYDALFQVQGTNVVLPCRVDRFSHAQIYWQDNEDQIVYGNSRMQVLPSGDLAINDATFDEMGFYTCTAKNMYGKDSATTFFYPYKKS